MVLLGPLLGADLTCLWAVCLLGTRFLCLVWNLARCLQPLPHAQDAFNLCLMGNYQERVIGMSKYWARDAHFYHVAFKTFNRDDAWGIYQVDPAAQQHAIIMSACSLCGGFCGAISTLCVQLWSGNNLGLGIVYDEVCETPSCPPPRVPHLWHPA